MVTVETIEELEHALNPRTAMIYLLADNGPGSGPMALEAIAQIARPEEHSRSSSTRRPRC